MSKAQIYLSAAIVFALFVAVFAVQNTEKIAINFLFWQIKEVSTVIIILAATASGALVMLFLGSMWQYKKIKQVRLLEGELSELKKKAETIPATEHAAVEQQQKAQC